MMRTVLFLVLLAASAATAQVMPSSIRLVVPFPPGGPVDFTARVLADGLRSTLGIPIVVDNRGGANGAVAAVGVKNEPPDGKTLLFVSSGMVTIIPHMEKNLPYDPLRDFTRVASVAYIDGGMVVGAKVPSNTLKEFVQLARASQPPLAFGSPGRGNHSHLSLEEFKDAAKINLLHVPYKGAGPVLTDVLGGQIAGTFIGVSTALPHVRAGRLKLLGVTGRKRSGIAPDIPTFGEQGYSGMEIQAWTAVLAPGNMRPETLNAIAAAVLRAVEHKETNARLVAAGLTPWPATGAEFARAITSEDEHFRKLIAGKNLAGECGRARTGAQNAVRKKTLRGLPGRREGVAGRERIEVEIEETWGCRGAHGRLEHVPLAQLRVRRECAERDDVRDPLASQLDRGARERQMVAAVVTFRQFRAAPRIGDHERPLLEKRPRRLDSHAIEQHQAVERGGKRVVDFGLGDHEIGIAEAAARSRLVRLRLSDSLAARRKRIGEHFGGKNQALAAGAANADLDAGRGTHRVPFFAAAVFAAAAALRYAVPYSGRSFFASRPVGSAFARNGVSTVSR